MARFRLTFAWRLALTSLLVTALGMVLLGSSLLLLVSSYEAERRTHELLADAEVEAAYLSELSGLSGQQAAVAIAVERFASSSLRSNGQVMRIFGLGGELLASSSRTAGYFPSPAAAALLDTALPALADESSRRYVAEPVIVDGQMIAVLELSTGREEEQRLLSLIGGLLLRATLLALLLALVGSIVFGRITGRRVERLRQVAEGIAAGNLDLRAQEGGAYELTQLARSLNSTADQLQERLRQLEAVAERERRFYRDLAHELRTPLTALQGYLEQIEDSATPDQAQSLLALQGEIARLSRLAGDLAQPSGSLSMPRVRGPVDLPALAAELCRALSGRAERAGVALSLSIAGEVPAILGDRDQLKQALLNLLDNALRHTPPGGSVEVIARPAMLAGRQAVELQVVDNGPGVDPALGEAIWERGVSCMEGGSGLGLAIVRDIATGHGGQARLVSAEVGAAFSLLLPAFTSVHRAVTGEQ